ncbi:MAG: hypothetical protein IPM23_18510 [Candidatus Melainabacteria bacterium]|nr:hypothetical protein [Candidatus Melainabacteria bacterium]
MFFDLSVLHGDRPTDRQYQIDELLAAQYAYLTFQHLTKITDDEWKEFFSQQWFPFITLSKATLEAMRRQLKLGDPIDNQLDTIASDFDGQIEQKLQQWASKRILADHIDFINIAVERYQNKTSQMVRRDATYYTTRNTQPLPQ